MVQVIQTDNNSSRFGRGLAQGLSESVPKRNRTFPFIF